MSFRAPRQRNIRWRSLQGEGLEQLTLAPQDGEIVARGVVIGEQDARPFGVDYTVVCDGAWCVREIDLATTAGMALSLRSDGAGRWTNHDGRHLPEFDGCLDVALAGTPFTHTLPIRRVAWTRTDATAVKVLYVPFDSFVPVPDVRRYRCLEPERRFGYEAPDRGPIVDLAVDADGIVLDVPGRFERA
jgi:hypothetical protein